MKKFLFFLFLFSVAALLIGGCAYYYPLGYDTSYYAEYPANYGFIAPYYYHSPYGYYSYYSYPYPSPYGYYYYYPSTRFYFGEGARRRYESGEKPEGSQESGDQ